jgi:hypothetical protein
MHNIEGVSSDSNGSRNSTSINHNMDKQQQQQQQQPDTVDDISSSTMAIEYSDEDDEGQDGYKVL